MIDFWKLTKIIIDILGTIIYLFLPKSSEEYFGYEEQTFARSRKPGSSPGTRKVIMDAYRSFGMRGLYTGFVPMLWRFVNFLLTQNGYRSAPSGLHSDTRVFNFFNDHRAIYLLILEDRDVTASGLYVMAYLYIRHHIHGHLELHPGAFETLMAGGIAGKIIRALTVRPLVGSLHCYMHQSFDKKISIT